MNPNFNPENTIFDQVSNPYGDRDPRFYVTVVYNECVRTAFWKNEEIDGRSGVHYVGNAIRSKTIWTNKEDDYTGIHSTRRQRTRTGYYLNKYLRPSEGENAGGSVKGKIFRLAEIILNTAECAINAGHIQEGMTLVNEIRDRAGMPAWPTSLTQDEALLYLKHERRVEMAMGGYPFGRYGVVGRGPTEICWIISGRRLWRFHGWAMIRKVSRCVLTLVSIFGTLPAVVIPISGCGCPFR